MANTDRFLIAPFQTGLQTDLKPWIITDDAFSTLRNAYVFRGRVRKRFGAHLMNGLVANGEAQLYSRLRVELGNTDPITGNFSITVPGNVYAIGQMFSVTSDTTGLDEMYTVYQTGTPAATLHTGTGTATYNTTTGALVITGSAYKNQPVWFYPATPVIGFVVYLNDELDDEPVFAFDTQFAYQWNTTIQAWERISAEANPGDAEWTGDSWQLMWGSMYRGINGSDYYMFVTNNNVNDGLRYYDGAKWNLLQPTINASSDYVSAALMVLPFKNRLILLNTTEDISGTDEVFVNRCRYSQFGDATGANSWLQDTPGLGGFVDAPVKQAIVSSEFIKDRLIVYFENSTWELAYTGNQVKPFRWQQINTELGCESTFSIVPFDKVVLGLDTVGVHACNGANVERIDWKIPDFIWNLDNTNEGYARAYGIRDYKTEMVYWTYPVQNRYQNVFPNEILAYNYRNQTFALFDDNITAFGYFSQQAAATWQDTSRPWEDITEAWNSSRFKAQSLQVICGNQEGFTFLIDEDANRNSPALQITNMTYSGNMITLKVYNHNFSGGEYLLMENVQGISSTDPLNPVNGAIFQFQVQSGLSDANTIIFFNNVSSWSGTYTGGGTLTLVNNINILSKQYNFYVQEGVNSSINKVDFQVSNTANGEVTVDYYISSSSESSLEEGMASGTLTGNGTLETSPYALYPMERSQERLWHPIYPIAEGEFIQLQIYMTDTQMRDPLISLSDFELHAMCFYTTRTSRLQ